MASIAVTGTDHHLEIESTPDGHLQSLVLAGRTYLWREGQDLHFDGGWFRLRERCLGRSLIREVFTRRSHWVESYAWDELGRPTLVDGMRIVRNVDGEVIACSMGRERWSYKYRDHLLYEIAGPPGRIVIEMDDHPRPLRRFTAKRCTPFEYDATGSRLDHPAAPAHWHRDDLGRLWTVTGAEGQVLATYLWVGFACIGRIDGPPGAPLGAVFSLDPTGTPVRVSTVEHTIKIPRDAFGWNLLAHANVPGLFGGAHDGRFVHFRSRVLDPRIGSFTAPDPFDGSAADPRRKAGFRGRLPVERPPAGPYCVCQNDPIGRTDPTGEMSAGVGTFLSILSSTTWAFQNNLTGISLLGLWNMILALLSFDGKVIGRLFDMETVYSPYSGSWGIRLDPSGLELLGINRRRIWTMQHLLLGRASEFDVMARARVFIPAKAYRPKLYGSLLWLRPQQGQKPTDPGIDFVLAGNSNPALFLNQTNGFAPGWSRIGGLGEPAFPGSGMPWFPEGGFHFTYRDHVPVPVAGSMVEIVPDGELSRGLIRNRRTIKSEPLDPVPAKGDVLLTESDSGIGLHTVRGHFLEFGSSHLVLEGDDPIETFQNVDLYRFELDPAPKTLKAGSDDKRLSGAADQAKQRYRPGDMLRLAAGAPEIVSAVKIASLEAVLTLDAEPPALQGTAPYAIILIGSMVHLGKVTIAGARDLTFPEAGPKPEAGQYIAVESGDHQGIYQVSQGGNEHAFKTDRDISAELVAAGTAHWYAAERETPAGTWDGKFNGVTLTFQPAESGLIPEKGLLVFKNDGGGIFGARNFLARVRDELVFTDPLPAGQADTAVTRLTQGECLACDAFLVDRAALTIEGSDERRKALEASPALHLLPLDAPNIIDGNSQAVTGGQQVIQNQGWNGARLQITSFNPAEFPLSHFNTHAPIPGQPVVLRAHGTNNIELAVVKKLQLTVTFDRPPSFAPGFVVPPKGWKLLPLTEQSPYFKGIRKNNTDIVLQPSAYIRINPVLFGNPIANIATTDVWLPRFRAGEFVQVYWGLNGIQGTANYRIEAVRGAALVLGGGPILPPGQQHYAVTLLEARSANNGSHLAAIEGEPVNPIQFRFNIWEPAGLILGPHVLTIGDQAAPVNIQSFDQLEIEFYKPPAMAGTNADVVIPLRHEFSAFTAYHHVVEGEWFFPDLTMIPSPRRILVQSYAKPDADASVKGTFSAGNARIPADESDSFELDARQSLEAHELQHTLQSLKLGPTLLNLIPSFLLDFGSLAAGQGLETPQYSAFAAGEILQNGSDRLLRIPAPGEIEFAKGRKVQMVQNANAYNAKLIETVDGDYLLSGGEGLSPGQVAVRLQRQDVTEALAKAYAWLEVFSIGGLQTTFVGPLLNLIPWAVAQLVHACNGDPAGRFQQPDLYDASVPDPANPFQVQVPDRNGEPHPFAIHDKLEILVDNLRDSHTVVAVEGDLVSLNTPSRYSGPQRSLRVGKIGEDHPMNSVVNTVADTFGTRDLRWFFDPLGQLFIDADPNDKGKLDWALGFLRPFYSTTAWSGVGLLGGFWLDVFYTTIFGESYYSRMEQDAANMSGRMYSPAGRLRGDLEFIGDLGRYHYYHDQNRPFAVRIPAERLDDYQIRLAPPPIGNVVFPFGLLNYEIGEEIRLYWETGKEGSNQYFRITAVKKTFTGNPEVVLNLETVPGLDSVGGIPQGFNTYYLNSLKYKNHDVVSVLAYGLGDGPGLPRRDFLRVAPFRSHPGDPPGSEPNLGANSTANSSQALPHELVIKHRDRPGDPLAADPASYPPSVTGTIPMTPALERSGGMYVAFSQPSMLPHRITVSNGFSAGSAKGRIAHEVCGGSRQTLIFDREVKDVSVFHAQQTLANELNLVYCQRADLVVEPGENRNYELTVADPAFDDIARNVASMTVLAQVKTGSTFVEIARKFDGHSPPTHLNRPFHVPVKKLEIKVSDTLALREAPAITASAASQAQFGVPLFLLVPAKLADPDIGAHANYQYAVPPLAQALPPGVEIKPIGRETLDEATSAFLGEGRAFRLEFQAQSPPEEAVQIGWDIAVEAGQPDAPAHLNGTLRCQVSLDPHFRLISAGGNFEMAEAEGSKLVLTTSPNTVAISGDFTITSTDVDQPQDKLNIALKDGGKTLEITATDETLPGIYHLLVADLSQPDHKARRTFRVI